MGCAGKRRPKRRASRRSRWCGYSAVTRGPGGLSGFAAAHAVPGEKRALLPRFACVRTKRMSSGLTSARQVFLRGSAAKLREVLAGVGVRRGCTENAQHRAFAPSSSNQVRAPTRTPFEPCSSSAATAKARTTLCQPRALREIFRLAPRSSCSLLQALARPRRRICLLAPRSNLRARSTGRRPLTRPSRQCRKRHTPSRPPVRATSPPLTACRTLPEARPPAATSRLEPKVIAAAPRGVPLRCPRCNARPRFFARPLASRQHRARAAQNARRCSRRRRQTFGREGPRSTRAERSGSMQAPRPRSPRQAADG